jgi:tRNA A-37 threonylcarbamoyl transferase component Bud32
MAEDLLHPADPGKAVTLETSASPASPPGYELIDEIGKGGMGVVYRARDVALDRHVAIKLLSERYPPDSLSAQRFLSEARITGQLQHPGIPAVHKVGTLADGRPFLAMKLIKGNTLEAILKQRTHPRPSKTPGVPHNSTGVDRGRLLAIFEAVCQAVGYAHAHRVIHRDLKPANVMVGAFGEVQVMDWGLAKVLAEGTPVTPDALAADQTRAWTEIHSTPEDGSHTQVGSLVGTPAFIPPEQALGEIEKVNERSDVFGLGALLAVILTGNPPYVGETSESVRVQAVRGKLEDCFARLDASGAEPDLVALCKTCLAFEPADRPADGGAVAAAVAGFWAAADERARRAELERVRVEGEQATAAAQALELRKRRRLALGAAAVLVLAALGGLGAVLAVQRQANAELTAKNDALDQERQRALANEQKAHEAAAAEKTAKETAQTRESETRAVLDFVENRVFAAARPKNQEGGMGYDVKLADALKAALPFIKSGFRERPLIEARLRTTLGRSFYYLGSAEIAADQLQRARSLYTAALGPDHPDTLMSMNYLASSYAALGRLGEALKLDEETLALRKAKLGPDHPDTLKSMNSLAASYHDLGRHVEALKLFEETLMLRKAKLGPDHPETLRSMGNLAEAYFDLGRHAEALKLREETLALQQAKLGPDHLDTLHTMNNLAADYAAAGRHAEALKLHQGILPLRRAKLGPDHRDTLVSMNYLADSYAALGNHAEALKLNEQTLALRKAKLGPDHPDTLRSMGTLAETCAALGRNAEALKLREETLALRKTKLGPDHPDTLEAMHALAKSYTAAGRHAEAVKLHEETAAAWEQMKRTDPRSLYHAGRYRAATAASIRAGDKARNETKRVATEADRAMHWLRQAVAAGYESATEMKTDKDLDALRDREDFQKLLAELETKPGAKAKPND